MTIALHHSFLIGILFVWGCLFPFSLLSAEDETPDVQALAQKLNEGNLEQKRDAAYALAAIGKHAQPALTSLLKGLSDNDEQVSMQSATAIGRIGPPAHSAVPALIQMLSNWSDQKRYRAAWALAKIGSESIQPLKEALKSNNRQTRVSVCNAFGWMNEFTDQTLGDLEVALSDPEESVRLAVVQAMSTLGQPAEHGLQVAIGNDRPSVKAAAIQGLGKLNSASPESINIFRDSADDSDAQVRAAAVIALSNTEMKELATLDLILKSLQDKEKSVQGSAIFALRKLGSKAEPAVPELVAMLASSDEQVRGSAALALGAMGDVAKSATPAFIAALKTSPDSSEVRLALGSFGIKAVPDLLAATADTGQSIKSLASIIAEIGPASIPQLIRAIENKDPRIRACAAYAFTQLKIFPEEAVAGLKKCLTEDEGTARLAAVTALGEIDSLEPQILEELLQKVTDVEPSIRGAVLGTSQFDKLNEDRKTAILRNAFQDENALVRVQAIRSLKKTPAIAGSFQPELFLALQHQDEHVRVDAAVTLASMKEQAIEAQQPLIDALQDVSANVRKEVVIALGSIGAKNEATLAALMQCLKETDANVVISGLDSLATLGFQEDAAIAEVTKLLSSRRSETRAAAVRCLAKIEKDHSKSVPVFDELLNDEDWIVRRDALTALAEIGAAAKLAVPNIFRLLKSEEDIAAAKGALKAIDTAGPNAVPVLIEGLESGDRRQSYYAIFLLGKIGPEAKTALPVLQKLLQQSENNRFREMIQKSIGEIESNTEEKK